MPTKNEYTYMRLDYPSATPIICRTHEFNYSGSNSKMVNGRFVKPTTLVQRMESSLVNKQYVFAIPRERNYHTAMAANRVARGVNFFPREWTPLGELAYNKAYARFRGKIYDGSAALGVTLGTYKESRDMIVGRCRDLAQKAEVAAARIATSKKPLSMLAGTHLEVIFGWTPLLADVQAATQTVIGNQDIFEEPGIKAGLKENFVDLPVTIDRKPARFDGSLRVGLGARVAMHNQNLWLAERAGLLNGAAVAWDLVPWSFVVNMFMNTGQLVNSVTDFTGLRFHDSYHSYRWKGILRQETSTFGSSVYAIRTVDLHYRRLGPPPRPTFYTKLPELNWQLASIAGSLFVQKFSAFARVYNTVAKKVGFKLDT